MRQIKQPIIYLYSLLRQTSNYNCAHCSPWIYSAEKRNECDLVAHQGGNHESSKHEYKRTVVKKLIKYLLL